MSERLKMALIAFAAVVFTAVTVAGSVGVALVGFGIVLFGLEAGFALMVLGIAGLVFAGVFSVRVLIPLVKLASRDSDEP